MGVLGGAGRHQKHPLLLQRLRMAWMAGTRAWMDQWMHGWMMSVSEHNEPERLNFSNIWLDIGSSFWCRNPSTTLLSVVRVSFRPNLHFPATYQWSQRRGCSIIIIIPGTFRQSTYISSKYTIWCICASWGTRKRQPLIFLKCSKSPLKFPTCSQRWYVLSTNCRYVPLNCSTTLHCVRNENVCDEHPPQYIHT